MLPRAPAYHANVDSTASSPPWAVRILGDDKRLVRGVERQNIRLLIDCDQSVRTHADAGFEGSFLRTRLTRRGAVVNRGEYLTTLRADSLWRCIAFIDSPTAVSQHLVGRHRWVCEFKQTV